MEIEQQHFGVVGAFDRQLALIADRRAIALAQFLAVQLDGSSGDLHPSVTSGGQLMRHFFSCLQQRDIQFRVLIDLH